jgi:hypothetical protein
LPVGFALISQGFHVQVAVRLDPVLVDLHGQGPDQPQATGLVGEDADDVRASLELLVDPLEHVGALELFVVLARQTVKRPGLLDAVLHPLAQLGILRLPTPAFKTAGLSGSKSRFHERAKSIPTAWSTSPRVFEEGRFRLGEDGAFFATICHKVLLKLGKTCSLDFLH